LEHSHPNFIIIAQHVIRYSKAITLQTDRQNHRTAEGIPENKKDIHDRK